MEILYKYISALRTLEIRPKILIIRFKRIPQIHPADVHVLEKVIRVLSERKIILFISDVDENIKNQFNFYNLNEKIGNGKIFYKIDDALKRAEIILNIQ